MMRKAPAPFSLTTLPVRVTATGVQPMRDALDVSDFDFGDALLGVVEYSGGGAITIEIVTGMQKDSEDGWVQAVQFTAVTGANIWERKDLTGLLRYARWKVTAFTGTTATFVVQGMLRRYC